MCYNCGCQRPDDAMGKGDAGAQPEGRAITEKTFQAAAEAFGMTVEQAKENTYELLKKEFQKPE